MAANPEAERIPYRRALRTLKKVQLRPAAPGDLELLQFWDRQPHVIAAKGDEDWQWQKELGRHPDWREQLIAEVDGRPIGFVEIIDPSREDCHYWGGCIEANHRAIDIWIGERDAIGQGYGTQMMQQAIARCFADPNVQAILVDPLETNEAAHRFYERLGFEYVVNRSFDDDRCIVYRLRRPGSPAASA
jgi:aminoglycoside 6'-N-acetyltransferase